MRSLWDENPDNIGPAVVNISADDLVIKNLTIENTQPEIGPHAFAIYGTGTRTILKNCTVLSKGGDTVSLWDYKTGMYYHDSCYFQGAVDFVCPRGWCYISNSTFYELKNTAAIWHAAATNPSQKFVLNNCDFQGADSFYLARHHYDAQFYFLNCTFPEIMRNKPIEHIYYPDKPSKNKPYLYGDRYYYFNCSKEGGNYAWHKSNTEIWTIKPEQITSEWTFDNQWNPEKEGELKAVSYEITSETIKLYFNGLVGIRGNVVLESSKGQKLFFYQGKGRDVVEFKLNNPDIPLLGNETLKIVQGQIYAIKAYCNDINFNKVNLTPKN